MDQKTINKLKELRVLHVLRNVMNGYLDLREREAPEFIIDAYFHDLYWFQYSIKTNCADGNSDDILDCCRHYCDRLTAIHSSYVLRDQNKRKVAEEHIKSAIKDLYLHANEIKELTKRN